MKQARDAYVATSEVTTLEHELGDDTMERRALVTEALLTGAESTEVLSGLGDLVIVEVEVDTARLGCKRAVSAIEGPQARERGH